MCSRSGWARRRPGLYVPGSELNTSHIPQQSHSLARVGESTRPPLPNRACDIHAYICMSSYICSLCLFLVFVLVCMPGACYRLRCRSAWKPRLVASLPVNRAADRFGGSFSTAGASPKSHPWFFPDVSQEKQAAAQILDSRLPASTPGKGLVFLHLIGLRVEQGDRPRGLDGKMLRGGE